MLDVRRARVMAAAGLVTAVAATFTATTVVVGPTGQGAAPASPQARVWVTTPDGAERMHDRGTVPFARGAASKQLTITVDPSRRYQTMDGFGASITDSSASVLMELDQATRDATMKDLFVTDGLSFLRQPIGSSDFVDGPHYTFDDMPPGATDYDLSHFSIDHDKAQILPLLRQALALNPDLKVMGTPWSPPAWMKTNDSLVGGRLIDDPRIYQAYADYLVEFVRAYEAAGVPIWGLTIQNEPQNRTPSGYPGTDLPTRQAIQVIDRLGPALQAAGLHTKILGYDHNWSEHPNDIANTPPGDDPETEYPTLLLRVGRRAVDPRHGVPLLRRRPEADDRAPPGVPGQADLVHRVLGLARPQRSAGTGLQRHPEVARPQPDHRRAAQLGAEPRHVEPRPARRRDAPQRRLRHLHGCRHGQPRRHRHPQRGVLHAGPPRPVREARSGPGRELLVRQHGVERPSDERSVRQPRRVDGTGGAQRVRRPAQRRDLGRRPTPRLHTARRLPGDLHLDLVRRPDQRTGPGRPVDHVDDLERRRPEHAPGGDRRRRLDAVDVRHRPGDRPVGRGRPRSCPTDPAGRARRRPLVVRLAERRRAVRATTRAATGSRSARTGRTGPIVRDGAGTGQLTTLKVPHNPIRYVRATLTRADGHWWQVADVRVYR